MDSEIRRVVNGFQGTFGCRGEIRRIAHCYRREFSACWAGDAKTQPRRAAAEVAAETREARRLHTSAAWWQRQKGPQDRQRIRDEFDRTIADIDSSGVGPISAGDFQKRSRQKLESRLPV